MDPASRSEGRSGPASRSEGRSGPASRSEGRSGPVPRSEGRSGPAIHLRDAVCLLGRFPALAGVDLDVAAGEVLLVTGPNGAGKTTLLRALAGLVPVTGGEATVLGHDLRRDRRSVRRDVALLGHGAGLYDDLTVAENVHFWAKASGRRDPGPVDDAMARAGVDGRVRDVIGARLSAGQRRRASLAILLARAAALWLLDEPHAGLDAAGRDALDAEIRAAVATGATVVVASHELDRAATLASRTITVAGGHLVPTDREPSGGHRVA